MRRVVYAHSGAVGGAPFGDVKYPHIPINHLDIIVIFV